MLAALLPAVGKQRRAGSSDSLLASAPSLEVSAGAEVSPPKTC